MMKSQKQSYSKFLTFQILFEKYFVKTLKLNIKLTLDE